MIETLKRLASPEYLVVADPGPMGGLWVLYVALGLLFAVGLGGALWVLLGPGRRARSEACRALAWFELWICLAGLGTVVGRFLGWPGWSARIWPYTLAALAISGALAYRLRRSKLPAWLARQVRILTFSHLSEQADVGPGTGSLGPVSAAYPLTLAVHLAGIAVVVAARYRWPLWTAPLVLVALLAPQAPLLPRRRRPSLMALAPLLGAYGVTGLWLVYEAAGITVTGWQGLVFPDPMTSLFYVDAIILAAVAYSLLCQVGFTATALGKPRLQWRWAVAGLLIATLTWAGIVYFGKRTHGATASDPYAYAQMGLDLAETGSFLHRYELFQEVMPLEIAWAPLQPVGYWEPRNNLGDCPSVWATGASALLAAGYLLLGETGLYVTTPIVALLALAATWALVQETLRGQSRAIRYLTGAITVALLATSPEHVDRLLVPMADAAAQLFTVLTLLFALRGMRQLEEGRRGLISFVVAGLSFACAYWTRHTQLVLALPALLAVVFGSRSIGRDRTVGKRIASVIPQLVAFSLAALLAAVPDIVYRWRVFGGPFATETTELPLMGLQHIGPVAVQMLRESLVSGEWGYLFPLAVYGGYRLARRHGHRTLVLGSTFIAVLLVHLTYHSLRLRDLISLFPLVDLAVAYGAVSLVQRGRSFAKGRKDGTGSSRRLGRALLAVSSICWVILSLSLGRWAMIDNVWKPGWASFGYMQAEQRAAFDRLALLTEADAIIGASLNAGAVMMYTARDAVRPYDGWTEDEWQVFLDAMREGGRTVYLLDDGGPMAEFIEGQRVRRSLSPIEELRVPLFYARDRETGWLYRLEWE